MIQVRLMVLLDLVKAQHWLVCLPPFNLSVYILSYDYIVFCKHLRIVTTLLGAISFKFVICISGFVSRADEYKSSMQIGACTLPSFHVVGKQDILVDPDRSRK